MANRQMTSKKPHGIALWLLKALLVFFVSSAYSDNSGSSSSAADLPDKHGYILIEYHAGDNATQLLIERDAAVAGLPDGNIRLDDPDSNFKLIAARVGEYQVQEVSVPYFDLPFKMDVASDPYWRFTVHEDRVSYAGALLVESERSREHVDIRWLNRFASSLDKVKRQYADVLARYPLVPGMTYQDPFYRQLQGDVSE